MKEAQHSSDLWLNDLISRGFAYSEELPGRSLSRILRRHPELWGRVKIFDSSRSTHGDIDYSHFDYFGRGIRAYFLEERKEDFVNSLVSEFLKHNNMSPDPDIRRSFTHMLHDYGLCWEGCTTHNGPPIRPQKKLSDCIYWKFKSDQGYTEMTSEEAVLFLADLASLSPKPKVYIVGSNPLGRSDAEIILKRANHLGLEVSLERVQAKYTIEHLSLLKHLHSVGIVVEDYDEAEYISSLSADGKFDSTSVIPVTELFNYNLESLLSMFSELKRSGFKDWKICFPYGSNNTIMPEEYESILNLLYDFSIYGMKIRICGAPFIYRVSEMRKSKGNYWNEKTYLEARNELMKIVKESTTFEPSLYPEDNRTLFVDSDGSVYPDLLVDISLGNVKEIPLSGIYSRNELLADIRNSRFKGLCGICRYRLGCGGNRSRSYLIFGDPLASDPACLNSSKYIS